MTIPCNKIITKLKNNYTIEITITLQHILFLVIKITIPFIILIQCTKYTPKIGTGWGGGCKPCVVFLMIMQNSHMKNVCYNCMGGPN